MLKVLGLLVTGALALCATAFTGFCLYVGQSAHWKSDGPGMLFVMIGVLFGAVGCLVTWTMFLSTLAGSPEERPGS